MKRAGLLIGLVVLALMSSCAFVMGGSDEGPNSHVADPRLTVRLLHEKLGYLRQIEHNLRNGLAAAQASPNTTDAQKRGMEVRLLEARANRVDVQMELARWLRPARGDKPKGDKARGDKAKSEKPKSDKSSK